ncbi:MAG TPA: hypothetical protein PLB27_04575 [Bacteroidales bacterium]|jgi:hypothetical protein|nr:hypothetical protein [Bacteroidales bacterium]
MIISKDYIKLILPAFITAVILGSCGTIKRSNVQVEEDQLMITRRYVGDYIEYRNTDPDDFTGYNLIWIRTSQDSTYGKISAFGKECEFIPGDRLFLRRIYLAPGGISGYWIYSIENDSEISYKLTELQHDRKIPVQEWF